MKKKYIIGIIIIVVLISVVLVMCQRKDDTPEDKNVGNKIEETQKETDADSQVGDGQDENKDANDKSPAQSSENKTNNGGLKVEEMGEGESEDFDDIFSDKQEGTADSENKEDAGGGENNKEDSGGEENDKADDEVESENFEVGDDADGTQWGPIH